MIYIFTKNYKKLFFEKKNRLDGVLDELTYVERLLSEARATIAQQDAAFKKANEILTRRQKQPRDKHGKFIKKGK